MKYSLLDLHKKYQVFFYLFVFALFLINVSPMLFSDGMFLDGVLYASISRNLSAGVGTFWYPHLTDTLFSQFHEHPPLGIYLQSLFFDLFGDHFLVERLYCLFIFILVVVLIVFIWKEITGSFSFGWIPFLIYILIPPIIWSFANNTLENTMSVFVCISLLCYFKSLKAQYWRQYIYLILCGVNLLLAFLTKGFTGIYLLSLPVLFAFLSNKIVLLEGIKQAVIIVLGMTVPLLILGVFDEAVFNSLGIYLKNQVVNSIQNIETVDSRFAILGYFLGGIKKVLLLAILIFVVARLFKFSFDKTKRNAIETFPLFILVLAGVLPVMISLKQHTIYIITVYPIFVIFLGYCVFPLVKGFFELIKFPKIIAVGFPILTVLMIGLGVYVGYKSTFTVDIHKQKLSDTYQVLDRIPRDATIGICSDLVTDYRLHAYFSRYGNVTLDDSPKNDFMLVRKNGCMHFKDKKNYKVELDNLNNFVLYKRKLKLEVF